MTHLRGLELLNTLRVVQVLKSATNVLVKKAYYALTLALTLLFFTTLIHAEDYSYDQLHNLVQQAKDRDALAQAGGGSVGGIPSAEGNEDEEFERPPSLRDEAFKQLKNKTAPLTPQQIIELRQLQDKTSQAIATTPNAPPIPVSSTLTVDLSPGITPPVIRLSSGFVTSLVFVDTSGQPWPISDYSLGNPSDFNIQWDKKTNTIFIQSLTTYSSANLAIRLSKLETPIMLSIVSGQKYVDYRVDLQVQARGPNSLPPISGDDLPIASQALLNVLDGIPPPDSQELEVSNGLGRAWLSNGKLILRTQLTLLSPAWSTTISSPDGTRVYELIRTPFILASKDGKPIEIKLKGL